MAAPAGKLEEKVNDGDDETFNDFGDDQFKSDVDDE